MQLRPYQEKTVQLIREEIKKGNKRILVVLPTGGGKTHVLCDIAQKALNKENKVLALMHRRQLVTQMHDSFYENGVQSSIIMPGFEHALDEQIQLSTMQTYSRRLMLESPEYNPFCIKAAIAMIDECHHALNPTYQKILKHYEDKIIIGVTATPILSTGVGMGNYFQSLVSAVTVQELVGDGYLVPGVYYGPSAPDLSRVSTVMGDYHKTELNEVMNQPKLIGDVVYNWLKYAENRKTMVFAVKVSHSKALCEEFNKKGIKAAHLDNHSEDDERNEVLNSFRYGDTSVLCNVALYTEGTDIPEIECIVLARPTKSIGLHLQMIGRGARPNTGKQNFIVLDHGGNIDRLGLYEDEVEWSLDGKGVGYKKKTNRVKEKKLITCDICSHIFTGCQCPACGYSVPDYGKRISSIDADLVEIGKNRKKKKEYSMEEKKRWFAMLLGYARQKGYSEGWASHKYKEKMSVWPNKAKDIKPVSPDEEVLRYIKYQNIKWAKSKQKMEQTGHDQDSRNPRASKRKMGWDICYPSKNGATA